MAVKSRQLKQVPKQDLKFEGRIDIDNNHKFHGFFENLDEKDVRNMLVLVEIENNLMNVYAIENEDFSYGLF